jgi:hypothetical protein
LRDRASMKCKSVVWAFLLALETLACAEGDRVDAPSGPDAAQEGSAEPDRPETGKPSPDAGDGADGCANPVAHGEACSAEGAQVCGWERDCTDVALGRMTLCTCTNGRYRCGDCPHCPVDLRAHGCGIGQVCDAVTFQDCDGNTVQAESCVCWGHVWSCDQGDGGQRVYSLCSPDAGAQD